MVLQVDCPGLRGIHFDPVFSTPSQGRGWRLASVSCKRNKYGVNVFPSHCTLRLLRSNLNREREQHHIADFFAGNTIMKCRNSFVSVPVVNNSVGSDLEAGTTSADDITSANLPELHEIFASASDRGIDLKLTSFGPFFSVTASASKTNKYIKCGVVLGRVEGFIRPWTDGLVLHLDSVRMAKIESSTRSIFGVALRLGAAAVRFGYDRKCKRAELLAINDTDEYHTKVRDINDR